MAHLSINTILDVKNGILKGEDTAEVFKKEIIEGKNYYRITQSIELPPLITQKSDFLSFDLPKILPNFIGSQSVQASLIYLENSKETAGDKLRGKIVLIENADPGFDWIFIVNQVELAYLKERYNSFKNSIKLGNYHTIPDMLIQLGLLYFHNGYEKLLISPF